MEQGWVDWKEVTKGQKKGVQTASTKGLLMAVLKAVRTAEKKEVKKAQSRAVHWAKWKVDRLEAKSGVE